ncbi:MAG: threonine synthase [Endomicrobia bacterium]|nr:threonine synthase [Endomicrobiia bacterium]
MTRIWPGVIEHFKEVLPISEKTPIVTLYEGNTPLVKAENLEYKLKKDYGIALNIYLKYEGANPTGSFKDRGMTVAISKAKENKAEAVICASTGNTSASAAAYAAKAKLRCIVLIPKGAIALGKLSQAVMHGAEVFEIEGNFDDALRITKEIAQNFPITLVNSLNTHRIEGQKTASFEIIEQLGFVPDYQFMPVGNAGNITAYWKGYKEFAAGNFSLNFKCQRNKLPKMMGFQANGAAPIVKGKPIKSPKTIATAIRIGNPASWKYAEQARDESNGVIDTVTDKEILQAYFLLSSLEGIFVEPASASSIAGLLKYTKNGFFKKEQNKTIVCILTGHGLKDPDCAIVTSKKYVKVKKIKPELKYITKELKL